MINAIEKMAVNSWRNTKTDPNQWRDVASQFFGVYRLALFGENEEAADLAEFIYELAFARYLND
jgi:hypothetical protein